MLTEAAPFENRDTPVDLANVQPASVPSAILELARHLVGSIDMVKAQRLLRMAMHGEALKRTRGSRRAAAKLLGVDRRYVQRLAETADGSTKG